MSEAPGVETFHVGATQLDEKLHGGSNHAVAACYRECGHVGRRDVQVEREFAVAVAPAPTSDHPSRRADNTERDRGGNGWHDRNGEIDTDGSIAGRRRARARRLRDDGLAPSEPAIRAFTTIRK